MAILSKTKFILALFLCFYVFMFLSVSVTAQDSSSLIPGADADSEKYRTGDYTLCDFLQIFVNASRWILGLSGGAALILFIFGGFTWITAAGSAEKVEKGKKIMTGTIFGLVIVLGAWFLVGSIIGILVPTSVGGESELTGNLLKWWEIKCP